MIAAPTGDALPPTDAALFPRLAAGEACLDFAADRHGIFVDHEMAGVEPDQARIGQVALIGFGARRDEDRIVLAPQNQRLRPILTEQRVPFVVRRDVRAIILEQVELDRVVAGTVEQRLIDRPIVGIDRVRVFAP